MRVLITGATGLIGREVLAAAPDAWEIVAIARTPGPEAVRWVTADFVETGFASSLPAAIDCVLHLAQARRYRDFPECGAEVVAVNVTSTAALLDHAVRAGASRFVLASTATVYEPSLRALPEDAPVRADSIYGASKLAAEMLTAPYRDLLACRILRIFTAFGDVRDDRLVSDLLDRVRTGRPVMVQGERGLVVSPLHASDAAAAVIAAAEAPTPIGSVDVVNVGGPPLGIRDMADAIGRVLHRAPVFESRGGVEPAGYNADRSKSERVLGLGEPLGFEAAMARMLDETVPAES